LTLHHTYSHTHTHPPHLISSNLISPPMPTTTTTTTTRASEHAPLLRANAAAAAVQTAAQAEERRWPMTIALLRGVLLLAAAAALGAALRASRQFRPDDRHAHQCARLADDCFRLGIAWPAANAALGAAVVASLVLQARRAASEPPASRKATRVAVVAGVSFRDNRLRMAVAAVGVAAVGAATPLAFLRLATSAIQSGSPAMHAYHGAYWRSHLAFWATALAALGSGALLRAQASCQQTPAFHWLLALALVLQLALSALAEGFFSFFTGAHVYEPVLHSLHARFVLISGGVCAAAALIPLITHRRGFYQLDAQLGGAEHRAAAAALAESDD
ncbi:hypothetical protein GGF44_006274, partial [Coemansia sp. RSA 1694]